MDLGSGTVPPVYLNVEGVDVEEPREGVRRIPFVKGRKGPVSRALFIPVPVPFLSVLEGM